MPDYDFHQLSPSDFEHLKRDVLQARDGMVLESFTSGRDRGIDLRHARAGKSTLVQCKHYRGTGLKGLISSLKAEVPKVRKLEPTKYIVATSVGLTPDNKAEIKELFGDILAEEDILGRDDLNNLLGRHPDVERQHFKLWLASSAVLERIVHNGAVVQTELEIERIERDIQKYVYSAAYKRALDMLAMSRVVIISGAPGVGKTTLARMLLYRHLEGEYQPVYITEGFGTARNQFQKGKKQIFFYDDVFGATFLGERATTFTKNEDAAILDFIELVRSSPDARFVMTTRHHILNQAIAASEKLKHARIIGSNCVLEIGDYSRQQRAAILYNHLYFSDLPDDYREELLAGKFYNAVVDHKKFNPRLIEWLSTFQRIRDVPLKGYQHFIRGLLENPAEIWKHAYERQISDAARSVLLALYSYGSKSGSVVLQAAFEKLHALRGSRYGFRTDPSDWRHAVRELNGSFLYAGSELEVLDPSVTDVLNTVVGQDPANSMDIIEGAVRFEQARRIWDLGRSRIGGAVLTYLERDPAKVGAAFFSLMEAPNRREFQSGVAYFDDNNELRLATLIDVADALHDRSVTARVVSEVARTLTLWESEVIGIDEGVSLMEAVTESEAVFGEDLDAIKARMVHLLIHEASAGCGSVELERLIRAVDNVELPQDLVDLLQAAVLTYRDRYFVTELHECQTESDFDGLKGALDLFSHRLKVDLEGPQHAVQEATEEYEEMKSQREERAYDEWKDSRYEARASGDSVDDLFDSLRRRE